MMDVIYPPHGPKLPDDTDTIIDNVINSKLPEFVKGKSVKIVCLVDVVK